MDLEFACPHCGMKLVIDQQYAGQSVECPGCHQLLDVPGGEPLPAVPEPPAAPVPPSALADLPDAPADSHARITRSDRPAKMRWLYGLIAGGVAALVCGGLWGMIGIWTNTEHSLVAILVGVAVGFAVRVVSGRGTAAAGIMAAVLAACGILLGKAILTEHLMNSSEGPLGSMLTISEALTGDPTDEQLVVLIQTKLEQSGEMPDPTAEIEKLNEAGESENSFKYKSAVHKAEAQSKTNRAAAQQKFDAMTPADRQALAAEITDGQLRQYLLDQMLADGRVKLTYSEDDLVEKLADGEVSEAEGKKMLEQHQREVQAAEAEAEKAVKKLTPAEREKMLAESRAEFKAQFARMREELRKAVFKSMFNFMDILFFLVALVAAWQIVTKSTSSAD